MPGALIDAVEVLGGHVEAQPDGDGILVVGLSSARMFPEMRQSLRDHRAEVRTEVLTRAAIRSSVDADVTAREHEASVARRVGGCGKR